MVVVVVVVGGGGGGGEGDAIIANTFSSRVALLFVDSAAFIASSLEIK